MDEAQLTDQAILRRMVLKRCIYGVDKNPLTVELAKVSLWLHSFTVGAPLSFLDHHLRRGDSLVGMRVLEAHGRASNRLGGLFRELGHRRRRDRRGRGCSASRRCPTPTWPRCGSPPHCSGRSRRRRRTCAVVLDFLCGLRWHDRRHAQEDWTG